MAWYLTNIDTHGTLVSLYASITHIHIRRRAKYLAPSLRPPTCNHSPNTHPLLILIHGLSTAHILYLSHSSITTAPPTVIMSSSDPPLRELLPTLRTTLADLRAHAAVLRERWTALAVRSAIRMASLPPHEPYSDGLVEALEVQVVHILYYDTRVCMYNEIERWFDERKPKDDVPAATLCGRRLRMLLGKARNDMVRVLWGDEDGMRGRAKTEEDIATLYLDYCMVGCPDITNSPNWRSDVTYLIRVRMWALEREHRQRRIAFNVMSYLADDETAPLRLHREDIAQVKVMLVREAVDVLDSLSSLPNTTAEWCPSTIDTLRRTVCAIKDFDAVLAVSCRPSQAA